MSRFSSNLHSPLRSRFSRGPSAASGKRPLILSSSLVVVSTPTAVVNPPSNKAGSLAPVPSHGNNVNKDPVTSVESFEPTP